MTRTFSHQVYDTGGTTPQKNAIQHMQARSQAQNNLAKSGGGQVTVPQFREAGPPVSPNGSNSQITGMASAQLKSDSLSKAQANTGKPITGGKKSRKYKSKKYKKRKTRKYYFI
jgi:hypothetical protein